MSDSVQLEDAPCPSGCEKNDAFILTGQDRLHNLPGEYAVVKCIECGLMRTNPRPTDDTIGFYYPEDYGPYLGTRVLDEKEQVSNKYKDFFRPLVRWIFDSKSTALPPIVPGRLMEIGCASGAFLHQMANEGWQVEGVEYSEDAAQAARKLGYPVYTGSLESAPKPGHDFDLIVGWMVLEHLHQPVASLEKLYTWAKPGAWLALSIPDAGSLEFKVFREKWYDLHLPCHLYHLTPVTLEKMLSATGWTLAKVSHHRVMGNLLVSIAYALEGKGRARLGNWFRKLAGVSGVVRYALFPVSWLLGVTRQSGRMTIWARKTH